MLLIITRTGTKLGRNDNNRALLERLNSTVCPNYGINDASDYVCIQLHYMYERYL